LEVRANGFGPEGVGFGAGVEKVGHGFAREGAIWFEQLGGDVEQGGFGLGGDGGEQGVDGGHLEACGIIGFFAAGHDGHQDDADAWALSFGMFDDRADSFGDFGGRIFAGVGGIGEVVGADVDDGVSRAQSLEFSVLNAPKDILGSVPAKAEVEDWAISEE
jgi:hypothetical protein